MPEGDIIPWGDKALSNTLFIMTGYNSSPNTGEGNNWVVSSVVE